MSSKQIEASNESRLTPRTQLAGYDVATSAALQAPNGFAFLSESRTGPTSGQYGIVQGDRRVGYANLSFGLKSREVGFDVEITEEGHNLGATALRGLASTLGAKMVLAWLPQE